MKLLRIDSVGLHLHGKHEQLVIEDRNVDLALSILGLSSTLQRTKARLAVLFLIVKDSVDNFRAITHLDCLVEALLLMHVFENVGLQVSIDDENGDSSNVLECLLVSLQHLLHGLEWILRDKHLLDVLVDHLNLLYIDTLRGISTKGAKRSN